MKDPSGFDSDSFVSKLFSGLTEIDSLCGCIDGSMVKSPQSLDRVKKRYY
jgi:hypothetical protein